MTLWQSLVRERTHSGVLARTKTKTNGMDINFHASWYRPMMQHMIDGQPIIKAGDFVKVRTSGEGHSSQIPAYAFREGEYDDLMNFLIECGNINFGKLPQGDVLGPILAVKTLEIPPNLTVR